MDMRYFAGKSYDRNQRLYNDQKIRVKDEIPNEQIFLASHVYKSHESIYGEMLEPIYY